MGDTMTVEGAMASVACSDMGGRSPASLSLVVVVALRLAGGNGGQFFGWLAVGCC